MQAKSDRLMRVDIMGVEPVIIAIRDAQVRNGDQPVWVFITATTIDLGSLVGNDPHPCCWVGNGIEKLDW